MNLIEALNALKEGKRVRNKIWEEDEYIMLKDGFIKYGNGITHRIDVYGEYDMCDDTWEEYKEPILTDKEREYLQAVVKPFRDRLRYIRKIGTADGTQFISIKVKKYDYKDDDDDDYFQYEDIEFPCFEEDTMYANMEADRSYTLEELGL